jgi:peptide/nickel transport system substrate-binding protein
MKKIIVLLILLTIAMVACSTGEVEEKSLVILQGVDATTLDPIMHTDTPTGNIEYQIFDTLLTRNSNMEIVPLVAKAYQSVSDTEWLITLEENIRFHNGTSLTAKDVIFSIERILEEDNNSPRMGYYNSITGLERLSEYEVKITTDSPNPVLLSRLAELRIVPKEYVEEVGNSYFSQNPIGSGPYKLISWVKDEEIILVKNEDYWQGEVDIEKVIFKPVPESAARVMALQANQADIITNVPPHQVKEIDEVNNIQTLSVDSTRFIMLAQTMKNDLVNDIKVREAINLAIDVESIIKNILGGNATLSTQPVCNFDVGYSPYIEPHGYDYVKAKELFEEAGVLGKTITMQSPSGRYSMDREVAEAIKANLEQSGMRVDLQFIDWASYVGSIISGEINADIWLIGWASATFDAGTTLKQWLHSSLPMSQYRLEHSRNEYIDSLIDKGLSTLNDLEREKIYHEIIEEISNDIPFVNLYQQRDIYGSNTRIKWEPRSDEVIKVKEISWNE